MDSIGADLKAVTTYRDETGGILKQLEDDSSRQDAMENRLNMLLEDWRDILIDRVNERLTKDESKKRFKTYIRTRYNPWQAVIEEISDLYTQEPTRSFDGPNADFFTKLYERIDIDSLMETVNQYVNALNDVALQVIYDYETGEIDDNVHTPNILTVLCSSERPTLPVAVFVKKRFDQNEDYTEDNRYWVGWTQHQHFIVPGTTGEKTPLPGKEDTINPWGKLPFIYIHKKRPIDGFWNNTSENTLFENCINFGIKDTMDDFTRFWNSFKQVAAFGNRIDIPEGILLSPDAALIAQGDEVSLQVLDYQVDLEQLRKDRESGLSLMGRRYGIEVGDYNMPERLSGRALYIKNAKLNNTREKQEKIMMKAELDLFEMIKHITAIVNGKTPGSDETQMELKYAEVEPFTEPKDELEIQEKEIGMNLADIVDIFMKRNQQFSGNYEEAKKKLVEIFNSNNEFKQMLDNVIMNELNRDELTRDEPQNIEENQKVVEKKQE